jgi:hypothetical protein
MALIKNKKSVFFTIVSISLISLFLISFMGISKIPYYKNEIVIESEFEIFNSYVRLLKENYIKDIIIMNTKESIENMLNYLNSPDRLINNFQANFTQLMMSGEITMPGNNINISKNISNWTKDIDQRAFNLLGINSNTIIENINITQYDPWTINVLANITINASLLNMSYLIKEKVNYSISILGIRDPLYRRNFNYNHSIKKTPINKFKNLNDIKDMIDKREYNYHNNSPSFIMRFENKTSGSKCCGIHSFINSTFASIINNSDSNYISFLNFSHVDFYSNNKINSCGYATNAVDNFVVFNISGISDKPNTIDFNLDIIFIELYNISDNRSVEICDPDDQFGGT